MPVIQLRERAQRHFLAAPAFSHALRDEGEALSFGSAQRLCNQWAYNIIGLYENERWSGRLAYNWRSSFIGAYAFAANPSGVYELYVDDTAQMDGSLSFDVNDNFTLTFEAVNILDTEFKDYFNEKHLHPSDMRRYDRTYEFGFRASFRFFRRGPLMNVIRGIRTDPAQSAQWTVAGFFR